MREPLSGWRGDDGVPSIWYHHPLRLSLTPHPDAEPVEWGIAIFGRASMGMVWTSEGGERTRLQAQLAAENAARAMVADMAKALGGSVTWATEGGE